MGADYTKDYRAQRHHMKEITKKWIELARADLDAAQTQFHHGKRQGSAYQIAVFHCHQAIEKILKAYLVERDIAVTKTHDLSYLHAKVGLDLPVAMSDFIARLNPHYLLPRYPDLPFSSSFSFTYNRKNVLTIITETHTLFLWLEKRLSMKKK